MSADANVTEQSPIIKYHTKRVFFVDLENAFKPWLGLGVLKLKTKTNKI